MRVTNSLVSSYNPAGIAAKGQLDSADDLLAFHAGNLAIVQEGDRVARPAFWSAVRRNQVPLLVGANAAVTGLVIWCPPGAKGSCMAALYDLDKLTQLQTDEADYVVQSPSVRQNLTRKEVQRKLNGFGVVANAPFIKT